MAAVPGRFDCDFRDLASPNGKYVYSFIGSGLLAYAFPDEVSPVSLSLSSAQQIAHMRNFGRFSSENSNTTSEIWRGYL
jgi:hypothetical protein